MLRFGGWLLTSGYCMVYPTFKCTMTKITPHGSFDHMPKRSMSFSPTNIRMQKKCFCGMFLNKFIVSCYVLGTVLRTCGTPIQKQNRKPYSCGAYCLMGGNVRCQHNLESDIVG